MGGGVGGDSGSLGGHRSCGRGGYPPRGAEVFIEGGGGEGGGGGNADGFERFVVLALHRVAWVFLVDGGRDPAGKGGGGA